MAMASLLMALAAAIANCRPMATGLRVRIAKAVPCGIDSRHRDIIPELLPGHLKINGQPLNRSELGQRLGGILQFREWRYVFVYGDGGVAFQEVADSIDIASTKADYIAVLTPSVAR